MAGVDWQLGEHVVLGAAAGSERLDTRLYDRNSRARLRGTTFGLYAQGEWNNGFAVGGSVSRGDYRTRTTREVPLLGQTLHSRQDSDVTIAQVEGSWTWTHGRTQLQPAAALRWCWKAARTRSLSARWACGAAGTWAAASVSRHS
ncbi:hypothetical protein G6F59_017372 [Rhizopus arrhizus]|nr:hypothetical protein G6F59_017372 [Rhizopus arrhizus]